MGYFHNLSLTAFSVFEWLISWQIWERYFGGLLISVTNSKLYSISITPNKLLPPRVWIYTWPLLIPVDTLVKVLSRYPMTYCMPWKVFLLTVGLHFIPFPKGMGKVWFIYCRNVLSLSHVPRANSISVVLNIKYLDLTSSYHSTWISIQV